MRRRRIVAALGVGGTAVAGCLARPGSDASDDSTDGGDETDAGSQTDAGDRTDADSGTDTPDDSDADGRRLVVDEVTIPTDAVRLNDLGTSPAGEIRTVASLSARQQRVVERAAGDGYETSELPAWLVTFAAETRLVEWDEMYYRLTNDFPRYELTARETTESAVEGAIADAETYREAVTHDGVRRTGLLRTAREEPVRLVDPWQSLQEFVETYDAVRFRGSILSISWTVVDDGPPYTVTAEQVSLTALADGSVYDATDAPERIREAVRAAGGADGVYAGELPDRLLDAVANHRYVYLDETFYWAAVERRGSVGATVTAETVRASVDGRDEPRLRLAVVNQTDRTITVTSGAPPPFGVLSVTRPGTDRNWLLWTDAYRENTHVATDGRSVTSVELVGVGTELPAGERRERTFTIVGELSVGEYLLRDSVGVTVGDEDTTLPFRVALRVVDD